MARGKVTKNADLYNDVLVNDVYAVRNTLPNVVVLLLLFGMQEVPISYVDFETGYCDFPQSLQANAVILPRQIPFMSVHYL
jgi:hypothetical protein